MYSRADVKYASQIRGFHAPLWRAWRKDGVPDDVLRDSLRRLYETGHRDTEVAIMFGVSRERVRQWRKRFGLPGMSDLAATRAWDESRKVFRALSPGEALQHDRRQRQAAAAAARSRMLGAVRERSVACLRRQVELGHIPTRSEIAAELQVTMSRLRAAWREPGDSSPHRDAFRRLYDAAGILNTSPRRRQRHDFPSAILDAMRAAHARGATITELAWNYRVSYGHMWRIVRGMARANATPEIVVRRVGEVLVGAE